MSGPSPIQLTRRLVGSEFSQLEPENEMKFGPVHPRANTDPACKLVQTWGFTDKQSWIEGFYPGYGWALGWDSNYQKKPAYGSMSNAQSPTP